MEVRLALKPIYIEAKQWIWYHYMMPWGPKKHFPINLHGERDVCKSVHALFSGIISTKKVFALSGFDPFGLITFEKCSRAARLNYFIPIQVSCWNGQLSWQKSPVCLIYGPHGEKAVPIIQVILYVAIELFGFMRHWATSRPQLQHCIPFSTLKYTTDCIE